MKTFEDEYQELLRWFFDAQDNISPTKWEGGLDGTHTQKEREIGDEYRKKLYALKEKYNTYI